MKNTATNPLPCGLCGQPARVSRRSGVTGTACKSKYYREAVVCTGCGVTTKEVKVPGVAVERWNTRSARIAALEADNALLVDERERLRKALRNIVKWYGLRDGGENDDLLPPHRQRPEIATAMGLLEPKP